MEIEEQLTRLVERHEALTGSVELLTSDIHELSADVKALLIIARIQEQRLKRLEDRSGQ